MRQQWCDIKTGIYEASSWWLEGRGKCPERLYFPLEFLQQHHTAYTRLSKPLGMVFRTSQTGLQLGSHVKSTHCLSAPLPALQQCPAAQSTYQPSHTCHSFCFFCMEYALQLLSNPPPINSTQKSLCLMKYHRTLVRMANIKKSVKNMLEMVWKTGNAPILLAGREVGTARMEKQYEGS